MSAPARLLLFGDEQVPLPGFRGWRLALAPGGPGRGPEPDREPPPGDGQLTLGHTQLMLDDAEPEPTQPSLLVEPPFWEAVELSPAIWAESGVPAVGVPTDRSTRASPRAVAQLRLFRTSTAY